MPAKEKKQPTVPRPSSSVIVISPENQVLLLHRVRTSSSFPSAHVFPGGNLSTFHDGEIPSPEDPSRHQDSEAYRTAAIRETFEESGILLAKNNGFGRLIEVKDAEREEGRRLVHSNKVEFRKWLAAKGGRPDIDNLIPFTRWVTPTNVPKRFTTQMYIYLLPLSHDKSTTLKGSNESNTDSEGGSEVVIPDPTHDGGKEHTAARFLPPSKWLQLAQSGRIIMFPPQFFLLHLISPFLSPEGAGKSVASYDERQAQRKAMLEFVRGGNPPWAEQVISPIALPPSHGGKRPDGRIALGLDKPGPELKGLRKGEPDHCVLVEFKKEGPRRLEVRTRKSVLEEGRTESKL
ncbi:hypothetical protein K461DRAFT_279140 [Myriangium duriaei CBS 260.36]|uniref:Nudix hydrolase domain-containing protein n=1 Tax=Myriangium duriaei CBS 260.36 TaxID=1168546 RepID=A0A9P4J040_9PEZI|nr:hypothetical protein K461DRAFT_279140 [Myriangium duriaei CBS 260.36]